MSAVAAAAIGAGAQLGSTLLGFNENRKAEDRTYMRSLALMRAQNDFNMKMWQKNNEYNSPSNQLRLLKEAGLNPALYGQSGSMASPQSTEITSAGAEAPYNSSSGNLLADGASRTIDTLFKEVQIAKLRKELRDLDLNYLDRKAEVDSKLELQDNVQDSLDGDQWTIFPKTNAYQENRQRGRVGLRREAQQSALEYEELITYEMTKQFLRKLPEKQLASLVQDLRSKTLNNELLDQDVKLMKKYGISPNDKDGFQTLIKMLLRNPDAAVNVLDRIASAGWRSVDTYFNRVKNFFTNDNNSHANPKRGSW